MTCAHESRTIAVMLFLLMAVGTYVAGTEMAFSQEDKSWPVRKKLIGKGDGKSRDVSGIACTTQRGFPRSCLVIDDNLQAAQFVTVKNGELVAGDTVRLIKDEFDDEPLELDGEGVAFSKGFYYVIGSHGHPRDKKGKLDPKKDADEIKARIAASSQVVRFRAGRGGRISGIERTRALRKIISNDPTLAPFLDQRLEDNGVTIEGIAIKDDRTLFAGFREPVLDNNRAVILSVPIAALFDGAAAKPKLFRLALGEGRGVRDLAEFEGGLLILAGPAAGERGTYAIYSWNGAGEQAKRLSELPFDADRKPEGLLPLEKSAAGLRVLILFDSEKEGSPTPVTIQAP